jgi:mannonate dehydratase
MRQTWRWFGPADEISIDEIRQTGAEGIVTALHHIASGDVWSVAEIMQRQNEIEAAGSGLAWEVVESLPVSEAIKTQTGPYVEHFANYRESLKSLAARGIRTVCYNFMPVLDWTRTELAMHLPNKGKAMQFDLVDFVLFDLHILGRADAGEDYSEDLKRAATKRFHNLDHHGREALTANITAGLPGANERWTLQDVSDQLSLYANIGPDRLRQHLVDFLSEVIPTAEAIGIRLCCHPDDPPFALLGLPRVMSCADDYGKILSAVDSPANGATLCTGSLGVAPEFDPADFVTRFGPRIHFAHLRNTRRAGPADGARFSFYESEHLCGDTDLVETIRILLAEETRRREEGRDDWQIPMRPDHGQALLSDLERPIMPGYPLVGRMRGLAELRGIMKALN